MCRLVSSRQSITDDRVARRGGVRDRRQARGSRRSSPCGRCAVRWTSARMPELVARAGCRAPACRSPVQVTTARWSTSVGVETRGARGSARPRRRRGAAPRRAKRSMRAAGCSSADTSSVNGSATPWRVLDAAAQPDRTRPSCGARRSARRRSPPTAHAGRAWRGNALPAGDARDGRGTRCVGGGRVGDGHGDCPRCRLNLACARSPGRRRRPGTSAPSRPSLRRPSQKRDVAGARPGAGRAIRRSTPPAGARGAQPLRSDEERGVVAVQRRPAGQPLGDGDDQDDPRQRVSAIVSTDQQCRRGAGRGTPRHPRF